MRVKLLITALLICVYSSYAKNTALLIGIGEYDTQATGWHIIHGNNDVAFLESKLQDKDFSVIKLIDSQATKRNIENALANLVSATASGDTVYIHFSGHGQQIEDMHNEESDSLNEAFVCYDACVAPSYKIGGIGYRGQNHFIDDELFPFLNQLKSRTGQKGMVIVSFDTCYSGGADRGEMADDPYDDSDVEWDEQTRGSSDEFPVNKTTEAYLRTIKKPGNYASGGRITVISACESDKKNYECKERRSGRQYGSLSYCIGKMLDNDIPMSQWHQFFVAQKYVPFKIFRPSQRPVVESHQ